MKEKDMLDFWEVETPIEFEALALKTFKFQYHNNTVYRSFCDLINCNPVEVHSSDDIPHLPITFFKSKKVISFEAQPTQFFSSSATTGVQTSKHFYRSLVDYEMSFKKGFEYFYGPVNQYTVLALLPSYLERSDSSLIYMVHQMIQESGQEESGFYLNQWKALKSKILELEQKGKKTLLLGVSFALMDFIERYKLSLENTIVMETGGMKGRRKELTREALHEKLREGFGCKNIHSEYGMTELFSQAYSKGAGMFACPPWMRISVRENQDPFHQLGWGQSGGLNIIDLANRDSCSFIATQDLGKVHADHRFEVLGRFDASEIRGCNLMVI